MKLETQTELIKYIIKQYSGLCNIKRERLIAQMEQIDWWEKEKYRIKIQYKVCCICLGIILIGFLIVIVRYASIGFTLITITNSMLLILLIFYNVSQKKNTFKMLELIKEDLIHNEI